jgi:putative polyketide hydroxylase
LKPSELAGQPGTRAPHVSTLVNDHPISTLDLCGRGWLLLTGPAWSFDAVSSALFCDLAIQEKPLEAL